MNLKPGMTFTSSRERWRIVAVAPHPRMNKAFCCRVGEENHQAIYVCFESPNAQEEFNFSPPLQPDGEGKAEITPGYYLASRQGEACSLPVQVKVLDDKLVASVAGWCRPVVSLMEEGWTFTRLVPADEVEKAYNEGWDDGTSEQSTWEQSRAKRIAEGVE